MGKIANQLLALNTEKHAIRAAVNAAAGDEVLKKYDPLSAYPAAIEAAAKGGIPSPDELLSYYRIIFIDWDGTILKDCYVKPGDAVEAPAAPVHNGLVFAGWTKTAATLQAPDMDMVVGATYTFQDDIVYIKEIVFSEDAIPSATVDCKARTETAEIRVEWGDGQIDDYTLEAGAGDFDYKVHDYAETGTYTIKVHLLSGLLLYAAEADVYGDGSKRRIFTSLLSGESELFVTADTNAIGIAKGAITDLFTLTLSAVIAGFVYPNAFINRPSIYFDFVFVTYGRWPLIAFVDGFSFDIRATSGKYLDRGFIPIADIPQNSAFASRMMTMASRLVLRYTSVYPAITANWEPDVIDCRLVNNYSIYNMIGIGKYVRIPAEMPTPVTTVNLRSRTINTLDIVRAMPEVTSPIAVSLFGFDDAYADEIIKILIAKGYTITR